MDHPIKLSICAIISAVFIQSCAQPDGPVGSSVDPAADGWTETAVFDVDFDTSFAAPAVGSGSSPHLYAGMIGGIYAQPVLRFNRPVMPPPWNPDSASVDSAFVEMHYQGGYGDQELPDLWGSMHDLTWTESTPPKLTDLMGGLPLSAGYKSGGDTGTVRIYIPQNWMNEWLSWVDSSAVDTTWQDTSRADSTLNVSLSFPSVMPTRDQDGRMLRFRSRRAVEDTLRPKLVVFITARDSAGEGLHQDTLETGAAANVFIVENFDTGTGERLVIGRGAVYRSMLRFALDSLWMLSKGNHIVVNHAVLTLHRDRTAFSWLNPTPSLWPFKLTDDQWTSRPDSASTSGFALVPTAIDTSQDRVAVVVTSPAAEWASGVDKNHGVALFATFEGDDIDRIAFYSSQASDSTLRPNLTVHYTRFPQ